jgi:hypothetical protein
MAYIGRMPIVRFLGRVMPAAVAISFDNIPQARWEAQEIGLQMAFTVRIVQSAVEVEIEVNRYIPDDLPHLFIRANDLARTCVDTVSFAMGWGLTMYFETFITPDGASLTLMNQNYPLAGLCTAFRFPPVSPQDRIDFQQVLLLVMGDPALFMALNDLIQANSVPHQAPTNCGRVLDGLRKLITPGSEPKQGWPIFRAAIQADEAYTSFITEHSKLPRHGDRSYISGVITTEIVKRTWIIMNRFLEFRKRGNQPLPLAEFPLLVG